MSTYHRLHQSIDVEHQDGTKIAIDIELADLMKRLWDLGVRTISSCQELPSEAVTPKARGVGGYAWIKLANKDDILMFIKIITKHNIKLAKYLLNSKRIVIFGKDVYLNKSLIS